MRNEDDGGDFLFDVHEVKYQKDQREWVRDSGMESKYGLVGGEMYMPRVVMGVRRGVFGNKGNALSDAETRLKEREFVKKTLTQARQLVYPNDYFYPMMEESKQQER